jgi:hypothetical protein
LRLLADAPRGGTISIMLAHGFSNPGCLGHHTKAAGRQRGRGQS